MSEISNLEILRERGYVLSTGAKAAAQREVPRLQRDPKAKGLATQVVDALVEGRNLDFDAVKGEVGDHWAQQRDDAQARQFGAMNDLAKYVEQTYPRAALHWAGPAPTKNVSGEDLVDGSSFRKVPVQQIHRHLLGRIATLVVTDAIPGVTEGPAFSVEQPDRSRSEVYDGAALARLARDAADTLPTIFRQMAHGYEAAELAKIDTGINRSGPTMSAGM